MKTHAGMSAGPILTITLGALLAANATIVAAELTEKAVTDEIVVYGMRPAEAVLVLDKASMRVDVKQHALAIGRSVRAALDAKAPEAQVAAAERRTRG